jgi:hypothetical protein
MGRRSSTPLGSAGVESAKSGRESLISGRFTDEPVAEIVQCGEPFFQVLAAIETLNNFAE